MTQYVLKIICGGGAEDESVIGLLVAQDDSDIAIQGLVDNYNYESWVGYKPGKYRRADDGNITISTQEIDASELDEILSLEEDNADLALTDLLVRFSKR